MRIGNGIVIFVVAAGTLALSAVTKPALAVNDGGVLLVHAGDPIVYTGDSQLNQQAQTFNPTFAAGTEPIIWWVFLAFPANVTIQARGVAFGHSWTDNLHVLEYGYDEVNMLAVANPDWLTQSGSGIGMGFAWDHRERLVELYWMKGYVEDAAPATYSLVPHPGHGGLIGTNDRQITPIAGYGTLGFNGAAGQNPSYVAPEVGACCLLEGTCVTGTAALCASLMGEWMGNTQVCDPVSCTASAVPPELELVTESLILRSRGRGYVGQLELRNAATDPRAVLQWQLPWALGSEEVSGSCGFGLSASPHEGRLRPGESVRIVVEWKSGYVPQEPNCEIELVTNDPFQSHSFLPVETSLGLDPDWRAQHGMPTSAAVRVLSGNPIRNEARLALEIPEPGNARFEIHDAMGRRVWSYEGILQAGRHELVWPVHGQVAAGAYWGALRANGEVQSTHRMVVLR